MAGFDILTVVKTGLGLAGNDHFDPQLNIFIADAKEYLKMAGVKQSVIDSEGSAGVITRGVADLWNYGSGGTELSPYFKERAIQLALYGEEDV